MILVVDSNIVFAALLKESTTRILLLNPPCPLYAPRLLLEEIDKYEGIIRKRSGLSKKDFETILRLITEKIIFVEKEEYSVNLHKAYHLLGSIDPGDVPFLALALAVHADGIWTENVKHFGKQQKIKVWSTKKIVALVLGKV